MDIDKVQPLLDKKFNENPLLDNFSGYITKEDFNIMEIEATNDDTINAKKLSGIHKTIASTKTYLESFIEQYKEKEIYSRYIKLRVINSTLINDTAFNTQIGPLKCNGKRNDNTKENTYYILTKKEIDQLVNLNCANFINNHSIAKINWNIIMELDLKIQDKKREFYRDQDHFLNESFLNLQKRLITVKQQYSEYIAKRIGYAKDKKIISLLMQNPPYFPKKLLRILSPDILPLNARSIWKKFLRNTLVSNSDANFFNINSNEFTENFPAITKEDKSIDLFLIPMESTESSFESFLAETNTNLYILLADYGAGKTTVLQQFMFNLAKKKLNDWDNPTVRIPILLNLRDYNKVPDFDKLIKSFLEDNIGINELDLPTFRKLSLNGCFIILLDGFDEMLERVNKHYRRQSFIEIAKYIYLKNKVIVTGRPSYFPDYNELHEILNDMTIYSRDSIFPSADKYSINCLQLMDDTELEQYLSYFPHELIEMASSLIYSNINIYDLACRPVLANMIIGSAVELSQRENKNISVRELFIVYTQKWVRREEDKRKTKLLINSEKKAKFLRYLAMRMHVTGNLSIPYNKLGDEIRNYFGLAALDTVDYFSHDIRTCSFLNHSSNGEYSFIHKSFMDFFVAQEYEMLDQSIFTKDFNKPLTYEMIEFLDINIEPIKIVKNIYYNLTEFISFAKNAKEEYVMKQDYEQAVYWRNVQMVLESFPYLNDLSNGFSNNLTNLFYTMDLKNLVNRFSDALNLTDILSKIPKNSAVDIVSKLSLLLADINSMNKEN